jgi:steroid delta-isomerase-like uncharacterized protein
MLKESILALARRSFDEIWNNGNLGVADELFSPDYVNHDPVSPEVPPGPEGVKQMAKMYRRAFPDLRFTIDEMLATGDKVITRWTGEGTHRAPLRGLPASGRQVRITGISIHRIAGGRIVETWVNWDTLGMMEQLGAAQVPARRSVGR